MVNTKEKFEIGPLLAELMLGLDIEDTKVLTGVPIQFLGFDPDSYRIEAAIPKEKVETVQKFISWQGIILLLARIYVLYMYLYF
jgi:hypothetical protein